MATNQHHKLMKKGDWPGVQKAIIHLDRDVVRRKYRREMRMDDYHIIGWQRKLRHTHMFLPLWACSRFG